jgi:hypothetical protein
MEYLMTASTEVLGTIFFTDPATLLVTELLVGRDPETELLFAIEGDWLTDNSVIQSPFSDMKLKIRDPELKKPVIPVLVVGNEDDLPETVEDDFDDDDTDIEDDDDDLV